MNGYWFKLWSVLPYGTSRFLWFRLKTPFYCLWYKQGVLRTYSKKDHNGIPFIQHLKSAFYTLHMYMYIIQNRQWHLKKINCFAPLSLSAMKTPEKIQRCTLLQLVKGMCSGSSHNLKDGSRLLFHYFWNNYDRI